MIRLSSSSVVFLTLLISVWSAAQLCEAFRFRHQLDVIEPSSVADQLPDTGLADDRQDEEGLSPLQKFKRAYDLLFSAANAAYKNVTGVPTDRGAPFPRIPGPSKRDSIAVVGAGPAGVNMAYELKRRGFRDVTVFERQSRIGGKSMDVFYRGVHNTLSTYLLTPDYEGTIKKFMKDHGLYDVVQWDPIFRLQNSYLSPPMPSILIYSLQKSRHTLVEYFQAVNKYVQCHRDLFGIYEGELMRKPMPEVIQRHLRGSFRDFLEANGLLALETTFDTMLAVPGYGRVSNIGAIHGLLWLTPRYLVEGTLGEVGSEAVRTKGGFNAIFNKMIELEDIEVKFNHEVVGVEKTQGGVELSFRLQESSKFDFVVWAGLPMDFARVSKNIEANSEVLRSSFYKSATGALVNMRTDIRAHTSEVYLANILDEGGLFENKVAISTDSYAELRLELAGAPYVTRDYRIDGDSCRTRTMSVQITGDTWLEDPDGYVPTEDHVRSQIKNFFQEGFNATDVEVLTVANHQYLPQWSMENIADGYHWKLFEMQGREKVWFVGGGASWDSTKSILEYNRLLIKQAGIVGY